MLFDLVVHSVGVSEYEHYTAQAEESVLNPVDLVLAQIFHILLFYITLCPQNDVTSHLICINQNLESLGNQVCYYNKINAILHPFESSFK